MTAKTTSGTLFKKKVLLVDDHPMMRQGLAQVINLQRDLTVCGEAGNAREAMERIAATQADLAVVDISLEGRSGLELVKDLHALYPHLVLLVMSMHDESLYAERVLRAGARGYVMKRAGGEAVLEAIRRVLSGRIYVSHNMSARILETLSGTRTVMATSPIETLTDREFEVFQLIGAGVNSRQIAERLHLSRKTVDVYRQRLREKLNLSNSTTLIQHAVRWIESQAQQ